jgi:WD40 repeat protein
VCVRKEGSGTDGQRALTVTKSGGAQLWDRTGAGVAILGKPGESARSAMFSPDSTRIVTSGDAGPSLIWDSKLGTPVASVGTGQRTIAVAGFSPDGKRLIGWGEDGTWLWDARSGKEVARLAGEGSFPSRAFSADGSRLLTFGLMRGQASLWDVASGERLATFQDGSPLTGAALSADGSTVLTWSGISGSARVWPATGSAAFSSIHERFFLLDAVLRPDGAQVVTFSPAGPVRLWDAKSGRELAHLADDASAPGKVHAVFSPDLRRLVTVTGIGTAHLFDTATGTQIAELSAGATVRGVRFSSAGSRLVAFGTPAVLWDSESGRRVTILRHDTAGRQSNIITSPNGSTNSAAFTEDGTRLVTAGEDGTARLWSAADGAIIAVLRAHTGPVTDAVVSRDGATVLTLSADQTVRLWDAGEGAEVVGLQGHRGGIKKLEVTRDGRALVTLGEDRTARLWDLRTGRQIAVLGGQGTGDLVDAALDTSGKYLVTSSLDGTARVWSTVDGSAVTVLRGHDKPVLRATFSTDGTRVLTLGNDYTARLWRVPSGEEVTVLRHEGAVDSAQFCANGATIVTAARGRTDRHGIYILKAYLWDAGSGQQIATLNGPDRDVSTIAVTQDGARVLAGFQNGAGRMWDCRDGHVVADPPQHENFVAEAEFTGDGQRLVTVAYDRVGHLYAADLSREIARLEHTIHTRHAFVARNGSRIMTLSNGFEPARIWNGVTGERISSLVGHTNFVDGGALSPGGDRALTYSRLDGTARLWDTDTGRQLALLRRDDRIDQAAFSPDGARVLLASHDGTIRIFPVYRNATALLSHAHAVVPRGFTSEERQSLGLADPE